MSLKGTAKDQKKDHRFAKANLYAQQDQPLSTIIRALLRRDISRNRISLLFRFLTVIRHLAKISLAINIRAGIQADGELECPPFPSRLRGGKSTSGGFK
jgi:hypothetical protein